MYSFPLAGISHNYREVIKEPIDDKIYFCGEAYHSVYWATIHGAMETGIEVGKKII
jgi:lysine-specific histone demethylase 1B